MNHRNGCLHNTFLTLHETHNTELNIIFIYMFWYKKKKTEGKEITWAAVTGRGNAAAIEYKTRIEIENPDLATQLSGSIEESKTSNQGFIRAQMQFNQFTLAL